MFITSTRLSHILRCVSALAIVFFAHVFFPCPAQAQDLFVSSVNTNSVLRFNGATGAFMGTFASGGGLSSPNGLAVGPDGNLYVSSSNTNSVLRYNGATGAFMDTFISASSGGLSAPTTLLFRPDGDLYVGSFGTPGTQTGAVLRYNATTGAFVDTFVKPASATNPGVLTNTQTMIFTPSGDLLVSSVNGGGLLLYSGTTGDYINRFDVSNGAGANLSLAFGPGGDLFATSRNGNSVERYSGTGAGYMGDFIPAGRGGLDSPFGLAVGPDGNFYVSNRNSNQILRYSSSTGAFLGTFATNSGLKFPTVILFASPAPEPSQFAGISVGVLGLSGLILRARKRRANTA